MRLFSVLSAALVVALVWRAADGLPVGVDVTQSVLDFVEEDATAGILQRVANGTATPKPAPASTLPLDAAKEACQASWAETKTQCKTMSMKAAIVHSSKLKEVVKQAGQAVFDEIKGVAAKYPMDAEFMSQKSAMMEATVARLGETADEAEDAAPNSETSRAFAHMSCQVLWQAVENLCEKLDASAKHGKDAVVTQMKKSGADFKSKMDSMSQTELPEEAPKTSGNSTNTSTTMLGETKSRRFVEDEFVHNLDPSDVTASSL